MKAAIYLRQSEDRAEDGRAVARQLDECRALADRAGAEVVGTYVDNDRSASSGKPRPEWAKLLQSLERDEFDTLICWHTDRLYRRLRDLVDLVELAESRSLRILAVKAGDIDLTTPAGRMLAGMLGSAARYEMEQKSERQRAANRQRARRGVSIWTRRPYGFDRRGHDVFLVPEEAEVIRESAAKVLAGQTLASIVRELNDAGHRTTLGEPFTVTALRRVVTNPRVAGRVVYLGEDHGSASWPAILSPDEFDRLTALLADPKRRRTNDTRLKYMMSGALICDADDSLMYATVAYTRAKRAYHVYQCKQCKRTRKLDPVDELVEGVVLARLAATDAATLLGVAPDVEGMQAEADELRSRRDGLAALLADGLLSPAAVREQAAKLGGRISALERSIAGALGDSDLAVIADAPDPREVWSNLGVRQRRAIVRELMEVRILAAGKGTRFDPDTVKITWKA